MPYVSRLYPEGVGPYHKIQVCHNIYIQAASELGYTGLVCFILTALAGFGLNVRTRKMVKKSEYKYFIVLTYGLDAGMIGYLIAGSFVTVLYYPFFWIQLAMIAMLYNIASNLTRNTYGKVNIAKGELNGEVGYKTNKSVSGEN